MCPLLFLYPDPFFVTLHGLVTDVTDLYLSEWRESRISLITVVVHGGAEREVSTPFLQAEPVGFSPDKQHVLVLAGNGQETEREYWTVPGRLASSRGIHVLPLSGMVPRW